MTIDGNADISSRGLDRVVRVADKFERSRLALARQMEGLSVKQLAEKIGATPSAVSQFENGHTKPRVETVIRLSLALGVPPEFFAADPIEPIGENACHFRSLRSVTAKERKQVLAHGTLFARLVAYLREFVNFPPEGLTRFSRIWSEVRDPERLAAAIRDAWSLGQGPISDVLALLEAHGVVLVEAFGHSSRLDAFSTWLEGMPLVFLSTTKGAASRRRFDAVHELGHLVMHVDCQPGNVLVEREADAFGSAFLLPAGPFRAECPRRIDWTRLRALKRRWGVSLAAIVRRGFELGIFSEATYRRAYSFLNSVGWRTNEPDEPRFERPSLLQRAMSLLASAGVEAARVASDLAVGERKLEQLLGPVHDDQFALEV